MINTHQSSLYKGFRSAERGLGVPLEAQTPPHASIASVGRNWTFPKTWSSSAGKWDTLSQSESISRSLRSSLTFVASNIPKSELCLQRWCDWACPSSRAVGCFCLTGNGFDFSGSRVFSVASVQSRPDRTGQDGRLRRSESEG